MCKLQKRNRNQNKTNARGKFNMIDFLTALKTATNIYSDIELKKEQKEALEYVYQGRDFIAVLPTGFGKSVIFHLIPYLFQRYRL